MFSLAFFQDIRDDVLCYLGIYDFEYGLQTFAGGGEIFVGDVSFVGDGLLCEGDTFWEMGAVGAFNSFFALSVDFLAFLSGDEDDEDVLGGKVFCLRGTKALRTSSVVDSLPDSLGLGGVLDGLGATVRTDVIAFVVATLVVASVA